MKGERRNKEKETKKIKEKEISEEWYREIGFSAEREEREREMNLLE